MLRYRTAKFSVLLLWLAAMTKPCTGAVLTPSEKSLEAVLEAAILSQSMLAQAFELSGDQTLSFNASFSASSWSLSMDGIFSNMPTALGFTGSSDPMGDVGAYSSTGSVGGSSWNSSGSWTFTDVDPDNTLMDWDSEATLTSDLLPRIFDKHVVGKRFFVAGGAIMDVGSVRTTVFRIPLGPLRPEVSRIVIPFPPPLPPFFPFFSSITISDDSTLTGEGTLDSVTGIGAVSGTTTTVPEPPLQFVVGLVLIAIGRGARSSAQRAHTPKGGRGATPGAV